MKVGDKVYHKELAGIATISRVTVSKSKDAVKNQEIARTKYIANYPDGRSITFFGFSIGKTIFKYEPIRQLSLFDDVEN